MTSPAPDLADRRLDGNALAGPLLDLFAVDLSGAQGTCGHCGSTGPLGEQPLYAQAPALVLRCRDCAEVLLRFGTGDGRVRLDLSGLRLVVAQLPAPSATAGAPS
jgi:hypothetical protein